MGLVGGLSNQDADRSPNYAAEVVLALLLARHPGLVHFDELVCDLVIAPEHPILSEVSVHDGIADLVGAGLAYRLDAFVLASHPAVRAAELNSG